MSLNEIEPEIGSVLTIEGVECIVEKDIDGCKGCAFDSETVCKLNFITKNFFCSDVFRSDKNGIVLVKKEIHDAKVKYQMFVEKFGEEPVFAHCRVRFLDEENGFDTTIALFESENTDSDNDVDIFYYCGGLNDLLSLMKEGSEDFVVEEVYDYSIEC